MILIIAASLEASIVILSAGCHDVTMLVYPAVLLLISASSRVSLGLYLRLSSRAEESVGSEDQLGGARR